MPLLGMRGKEWLLREMEIIGDDGTILCLDCDYTLYNMFAKTHSLQLKKNSTIYQKRVSFTLHKL